MFESPPKCFWVCSNWKMGQALPLDPQRLESRVTGRHLNEELFWIEEIGIKCLVVIGTQDDPFAS